MAQEAALEEEARPRGRKRRWLRMTFRILLLALLVAIVAGWLQRERIAESFIADYFAENDVRASYDVETIGPQLQVLSNIVIGDPEAPDLTVERLELSITPRWGLPELTELRLVRPRLYGSLHDGTFSLGDLDALLTSEEVGPTEFPNMELVIEDGRGLFDTEYGRLGLMVDGGGHLRGGFSAELAAVGEDIEVSGCAADAPTLYGEIRIDAERPHFIGPLRFDSLQCADSGLALQDGALQLDAFVDRNLTDFEGEYGLALERSQYGEVETGAIAGQGQFVWRDGGLNALYDVSVADLVTSSASAGEFAAEGRIRAAEQFARIEVEGEVSGSDLALGDTFDAQLADAARAAEGTLAAPLLDKFRANLSRELRGSRLTATFDARQMGERTSVVVPEARLRGGSGATLLALSRLNVAMGEDGLPTFAGNIQTGGEGLPQISGRMEQTSTGALELRMAMREYSAGEARLSVPRLAVLQGRGGRMAIEGEMLASGPLPGGFAQDLQVPVDGTISSDGAIALWSGCRDVRFERLEFSNLMLGRQSLTLCPPSGRSIMRYDAAGLQLAAGVSSLDLSGELAETPMRLRSGAVGFAWPGVMAASDLDVTLGPADNAQRFVISDLRADLSAENIGGEFFGADVFMASVPLDVTGAEGTWSYNDILALSDVDFTLSDREPSARFEPLVAQGATLSLVDNRIVADAVLRHPLSLTRVSRVHIEHDLSTSSGGADLFVDGLTFGDQLQPSPPAGYCDPPEGYAPAPQTGLSCLMLGVVSLVEGTVSGTGRIDWNSDEVTSTGTFSSDSLDLAAPFGPVEGISGTVVFNDLLGLTTAQDQRLHIDAINPGIEVYDGNVGFELINGDKVLVTGGEWPFMGGQLRLQPVTINIGVEEFRTYLVEIEGLHASQFIERMELGNLAATGIFDGSIPIVFDPDGNGQLVEGSLVSRPPGGNVSYVGELTYEDMGFFANYAFRTLRDLRYDRMEVDMNGPLTGEIVTQVRFEGVGQGETAERNFVSRAIAELPIELRLNIHAPFYELMRDIRSLYDPAAVRNPFDLGLIASDDPRLRPPAEELPDRQPATPQGELRPEPDPDDNIQPPESEAMP